MSFDIMTNCIPDSIVSVSAQPVWNVDMPSTLDEAVRKVERGSRIVTVVPHDFKLVLQV